MKRLIIFDFYGVIGAEISPRWFRNHFDEEEAKILKDKYFEPADLGIYSIDETLDHIASDLGFKKEDIIKEWKSYVKWNEELKERILKLRKKNKVALLSNAASGIFELLYPMDWDLYFDKTFKSYEWKMKKPDMKFYMTCVNSFDEEFDEIYFIDDNLANTCVLDGSCITGIQFTSNEELFKIIDEFID